MTALRLFALLAVAPTLALADPPVIEEVTAAQNGQSWRFNVTIRHPDTGWDHYADGWEIRGPDGALLGERPLAHPHVDEQPFTRSLGNVVIPEGITEVTIRARCSRDGWTSEPYLFALDK